MASPADAERIAAYYDAQAERYEEVMASDPRNAPVRDAFRELVDATVPPNGRMLDFGCGTGVDARWYASHGRTVVAYDPASRMIGQVASRCAREIMAKQVVPISFPFADFPHALPAHAGFDAVTANFAVLNLVSDLGSLFQALARVLKPDGAVIANVLNPFYWRDLRSPWWWRAFAGSLGTGTLAVHWADTSTYRHHISSIVRAAAPAFRIETRHRPSGRSSQFIFLVFRRVR
jgi:ubiquinone/menaquinone biosynthesis C-methylase UbiE